MKQLTLTSEFFKNECAESFCKAILGNVPKETEDADYLFIGFDSRYKYPFYCSDLIQYEQLSFKLDDSFKVDWACLELIRGYTFPEDLREQHRLDLDYISTLEGVEIKEVEE